MTRITTFTIAILFSVVMMAQNVGVGTNTPATSAQLEVNSTSKGFLPPRMTAVQRDSITDAVAGLIVYCTNCASSGEMQFYNGSSWRNMIGAPAALPPIGQRYRGGILAYVLQPGDPGYNANTPHGLVAAGTVRVPVVNGTMEHMYLPMPPVLLSAGNSNTTMIISAQGPGSYAAQLCADLILEGYSDWYLPSLSELQKMLTMPGMTNGGDYWSSSESAAPFGQQQAWSVFFIIGDLTESQKEWTLRVRAIRSF